jgi:hypothetical protein
MPLGSGKRTVAVAAHQAHPAWLAIKADQDRKVATCALDACKGFGWRFGLHNAAGQGADAADKRPCSHGFESPTSGSPVEVLV